MFTSLLRVRVPDNASELRADTRARLERHARQSLLARTLPGTFAYPVVTSFVAWSGGHFDRHPGLTGTIIALFSVVVMCRVALYRRARRLAGPWGATAKTHMVLGLLSSAAFGSYAGFVLMEGGSALGAMLGGLITTVAIASSVVRIASIHRPLAATWVCVTLLPIVVFGLASGSDVGFAVAGLVGLYTLLLIPAVGNAHSAYWTAHVSAASLEEQSARMSTLSRAAGKAEVSSNILHDVGNAINGFKSTAAILRRQLEDGLAEDMERFVALLKSDEAALGRFVEAHPLGEHLVPFIEGLGGEMRQRTSTATQEMDRLDALISHIDAMLWRQRALAGAEMVSAPLRVAPLISHALLLADVERSRIDLEVKVSPTLEVLGDEQRVLQILVNLLSNAADAVRLQAVPRIEIRAETLGHGVVISVTDNGVGTSEPVRRDRFERGATTKDHGHGIGLHHAANLASAMRGSLSLESAGYGRGATATVTLRGVGVRAMLAA